MFRGISFSVGIINEFIGRMIRRSSIETDLLKILSFMAGKNQDRSPLDIGGQYAKKGTRTGYVRSHGIAKEHAVVLRTPY